MESPQRNNVPRALTTIPRSSEASDSGRSFPLLESPSWTGAVQLKTRDTRGNIANGSPPIASRSLVYDADIVLLSER